MATASYDEIAQWYETEFLAHQRRGSDDRPFADTIGIDQALLELLGFGSGLCLEVGCGTGIYADRVRSLGRTPVGIDLSSGMLEFAAGRLAVARADATRLPFGDESVDTVIGVMIHSDMPAFEHVLAEIHRVLRPGGTFVHVGVHPCFIGGFADRSNPELATIGVGYLEEGWTPGLSPTSGEVGKSGQVRDKVGAAHYSLAGLVNRITEAGFRIEQSAEGGAPTPITLSFRLSKPLS